MRIAVLGAAGFLGSALSKALEREGFEVHGIYKTRIPATKIQHHINSFMSADVWNVELIINAAVSYGRASPLEAVSSNLIVPLGVLEKAMNFGVSFINLESFFQKFPIATYSPLRDYSLSKQLFSSALMDYQRKFLQINEPSVKVLGLSIEHLYGPGDSPAKFVPWIISQMESGVSEIALTHGNQKRDFIFIDDAVEMIVGLVGRIEKVTDFTDLEIGTGRENTIRDFVEAAALATGYRGKLLWGVLDPPPGEIIRSRAHPKLTEVLGGRSFVELRQGIRLVVDSIVAHKGNNSV